MQSDDASRQWYASIHASSMAGCVVLPAISTTLPTLLNSHTGNTPARRQHAGGQLLNSPTGKQMQAGSMQVDKG